MQRLLFEYLLLCDHFQKSICSTVSEKESSTTYFSQCFWNFCCRYLKALSWKDLWQRLVVFQDVEPCILIKKWFHQGQFFVIFGDDIIPAKSLLWIPILVASNNISINKLVNRRYPLVHCDILSYKHILKVFHFTKNYPTKKTSVHWKQSFSLKKFRKIARKRTYFRTSFLQNFRSLIYKM